MTIKIGTPKEKGHSLNKYSLVFLVFLTLLFASLVVLYMYWPWRNVDIYPYFLSGSSFFRKLNTYAIWEFNNYIIGSLFILPIIFSSIVYKWKGSILITVLSIICIIPILLDLRYGVRNYAFNLTFLIGPSIIILLTKLEFELRSREKKVYIEREKERKAYLSKIIQAHEQERKYLANELHDDTIQNLLALDKSVEVINYENKQHNSSIYKHASLIQDTIKKIVGRLREISIDLRPTILDELGLVSSLKWLVDRNNEEGSVYARLIINDLNPNLNPLVEVTVFRIIQQALVNIQRHSNANQSIITVEMNSDLININIQDDGQGFIVPNNFSELVSQGKLGLIGMKERTELLGGYFSIYSKPMKGTSIHVQIPCNPN